MARRIKYTDKQVEDLLEGIYNGKITVYSLPEDLYFALANHLKEGLYKGFGGTLETVQKKFGLESAPAELVSQLRDNVYIFSAAKTMQQVEAMQEIITKGGEIVPYSEFREEALKVFGEYNETWLETEYNTALGMAENARKWSDVQENKETFPYLKYVAVMDANTSEICAPLDGTILPVDDPFWDEFAPLNHFNCRCIIEQLTDANG